VEARRVVTSVRGLPDRVLPTLTPVPTMSVMADNGGTSITFRVEPAPGTPVVGGTKTPATGGVIVPPHSSPLPFTGFDASLALLLAVLLLSFGCLLLVAGRRRHPIR
jgi:hypothetical protein